MFKVNFFGGLRGPLSVYNLSQLSIKMKIAGDAAFIMYNENNSFDRKMLANDVLINVGTHTVYRNSEFSRFVIREFIKILISRGINVKFLPLHSIDVQLGLELKSIFPQITLLKVPNNYDECIIHFKNCSFAFGERLHFIVMALLGGCPFISINYDKKHEDLLASINLSNAGIKPEEISLDTILNIFDKRLTFNWGNSITKIIGLKRIQSNEALVFLSKL